MGLKKNKESGQTVVEYILLIVVAISLVLTFYRSQAFKRLFGSQGLLGQRVKSQNEFSYRHAYSTSGPDRQRPSDIPANNKQISVHPSYVDINGNGTRFFGPRNAYPLP